MTNVSKIAMKGNIFKTNFIYAEIICCLEWALGKLSSGEPLPSLIGPGRNVRLWSSSSFMVKNGQQDLNYSEQEREKNYTMWLHAAAGPMFCSPMHLP